MGVDPRDQEASNDLVPTGSEVHLVEWSSTSSEKLPRQPPSDSVQSPAQKSATNSRRNELQTPLHWRSTRPKRAPERLNL